MILDPLYLFSVFCAGLFAGFIDAIAGGGGLVTLPTLMMSGLPIPTVLGTNKVCGTAAVIASSLTYRKKGHIDVKSSLRMGLPAMLGSVIGTRCIGYLPQQYAEPIIIVLLIAITIFVIVKPDLGKLSHHHADTRGRFLTAKLILAGLIIGFHDGFFGPGTGTFLVFVLLATTKLDFLKATGTTKVINLMTNVAALSSFALSGFIHYPLGICGALGMIGGSHLGARFASAKGVKIIKPLFIFVAIVMIGKIILAKMGW